MDEQGSNGEMRRRAFASPVAGVLLVAVVFVVITGVTLFLKGLGERGVQTDRDLQAVIGELHHQDALEWRVISGREDPEEVAGELESSRERARRLIARAARTGSDDEHDERVLVSLHDHYASVVDEELRLLAAGEEEEAERFDEAEVDPAFEGALEELELHSAEVSAQARRAQVLSAAGIVGTVLLSLALTAWAQRRRTRTEVRRQTEERSQARYRALVSQSSDLVLVTDREGLVSYLSPSAERLLRRVDGGPVHLTGVVHDADVDALVAALAGVTAERGATVDLRIPGPAGVRTFEASVQDLTADPAIAGLVLTGHDVTERTSLQYQLEHRALHDTLTGLPNRALLADRFAHALRADERTGSVTGLLLIDLDRFKEVNDTLGHHFGDELLKQVGPRLAAVLRGGDTIARLGGDEFAVLLPAVGTLADAVGVAQKLQAALGSSFRVEDIDLDVEASIGVVLSGEHGTDATTLMQRADIAMYAAKHRSLGVSVYDPASDGHSPERLALLGDLRRALAGDELFLHFQPTISMTTGDVCGAEALLRWQHPERGLVPPDAFIPLAENTGLITALTTRVLDLALAHTRRWMDDGAPLQVAVNLSARNLLDDRIASIVAQLLAEHGVPASLLKLEVTESAIMADPSRARAVLDRLDSLGVALSIDDFGAGYTSLGQLKSLPVSELKVDRSFVMTMETDSGNAMIVRSVIELGHNLGLTAVAEGVETQGILDLLGGYSCDVAQGFHLSRPLAAEAFDRWRTDWPGLPAELPVVRSA